MLKPAGKKILIVDDDPAIVDSIQMLLEMEGYTLEVMYDGGAIGKVGRMSPDLILLDIWMSGQDGREICKYLKKKDLTKKIPIIMISASNDVADSAKESGADDFIAKPFDTDALLGKIVKYVGTAE